MLFETTIMKCLEERRMQRKTVFLMYALILLLSFVGISFQFIKPVRAATTWSVDDDGPADFSSIQEAINAASSGDTIYVKAGTYCENVVVNTTVSLIGEDRSNTVIDGNGAETGILVTAGYVTVEDFGVRNCEIGIKVESNDNIISSNRVFSNGYNESELLIDQEVYQDYVSPLTRWFLHNLIDGSYTYFISMPELTPAVFVYAFGDEDVNQLGIGLFYDENGDHTPQLLEFVGFLSGREQSVGTFVVDPPPGQYIIKVWGMEVLGDPGHFDLEIVRYTGYGIEFLSCRNNTVSDNLVTSNPVGLYFHDSYEITVHQNYVTDSIGAIAVRDSTELVITDNNVSMNKFGSGDFLQGIGVSLRSVRNSDMSQNNVSSNTFGIWLWNSSSNELINNTMLSNAGWGIGLYASYENTVRYNNLSLTIGLDGIRMMFACRNISTKTTSITTAMRGSSFGWTTITTVLLETSFIQTDNMELS